MDNRFFFPGIFVIRFSYFMYEVRRPRLFKIPDFPMKLRSHQYSKFGLLIFVEFGQLKTEQVQPEDDLFLFWWDIERDQETSWMKQLKKGLRNILYSLIPEFCFWRSCVTLSVRPQDFGRAFKSKYSKLRLLPPVN